MSNQKEIKEFAAKVRHLRKAQKLTQNDLAGIMDCDVKTIKNIEQAKNSNPTLETVISLAKALAVPVRELF